MIKPCRVKLCLRPHANNPQGWCDRHFLRALVTGTPDGLVGDLGRVCDEPGCTRQTDRSRLVCSEHRNRKPPPPTPSNAPACLIAGCDEQPFTVGRCAGHYHRWVTTGNERAAQPLTDAEKSLRPRAKRNGRCAVRGCQEPAKTSGWCIGHYRRWYLWGDVRPREPLTAPASR